MIRVQFNDSKSVYTVNFKIVKRNSVVQLTGEKVPANTSGFKAYRLSGAFLGDYSEYTQIVEQVKDGYKFGKKG